MSNILKRFVFDERFGVRVALVDGQAWFVAKDLCSVLDINDTRQAVARLDDDERCLIPVTDGIGRVQDTFAVNEAGLYTLVLGSRKPEARVFKRWVTHDVLPRIRETGTYSINQASQPTTSAEALLQMAQHLVESEQRMATVEMQLEVTKHRIDTLDHVDAIGDKQQRLNAMVRKHARLAGVSYANAWREFRATYNVAYHTNLTALRDNYCERLSISELTIPEYLAVMDRLDDALRVMDKLLNPVGVL